MHKNRWFWTLRSLGVFLLCAAGIGLLHADDADTGTVSAIGAPITTNVERTYLYYFESGEATLDQENPEAYFAFGTLPKEKVTLVAYGLDDVIEPRLALTDVDGIIFAEAVPTSNPYVVIYQFEATENRRYDFTISAKNLEADTRGLVRVMLFVGDPIDEDRTLLDNVNPLLPGRSFMVGSKEATEALPGLSMRVESLPISRFNNERPDVFASRGSDEFIPTLQERLEADFEFQWFNIETPEIQFYTVTVRATPETMDGMAQLKFRQLNADSFFYYDYYLIIGAGSDPVSVVRGNDCETQPNRVECLRGGNDSGRTAPPPRLDAPTAEEPVFVEAVPVGPIITFDPPPPPVVITCADTNGDGIFEENPLNPVSGTNGLDRYGGTNCQDIYFGRGGNDSIGGGDLNDVLYGGSGNDSLQGGLGYDNLHPGLGNDIIRGDFDRVHYDDAVDPLDPTNTFTLGVEIRLDQTNDPFCVALPDNVVYTGHTIKQGGGQDCLIGIADVTATNFADIVYDSATDTTGNYIDTLGGTDEIHLLGSNGGGDRVYMGDGNDEVTFTGNQSSRVFDARSDSTSNPIILQEYQNDETYIFDTSASGDVVGFISISDSGGMDELDFSGLTQGITLDLGVNGGQTIYTGLQVDLNYTSPTTYAMENVLGTNSADSITTNAANNIILAGGGDDTIFASCGTDTLTGGAGVDTLSYSNLTSGVTVSLQSGQATDKGAGCGTDTITITAGNTFENLTGSNLNDVLGGDAGDNEIRTLGGDNTVTGGGGNDSVFGGFGNDTITTLGGNDTILDAGGTNTVNAGDGTNTVTTGDGVDTITTGTGADTIDSNDGADIINAGDGTNIVNAGGGNDQVTTGADVDTINGGSGDDTVTSGGGADVVNGDAGADVLNGGDGIDVLNGGADGDTLNGGNDNDTLNGGAGIDTLNGEAGDDALNGGVDNDILNGGADNDTLSGDAGDDDVNGDAGNDILLVTDLVDDFDGGADTDVLDASGYAGPGGVFVNLGTNVYGNLFFPNGTVTGVENIIGSTFNDFLIGDAGANNIQSGDGADFVNGGGGADTINTGEGDDTVTASLGADTIDGGAQAGITPDQNNPGDAVNYGSTDFTYDTGGTNYLGFTVTGTTTTVTLPAGLGGGTQTLTNIEHVFGSNASGPARTTNIGPNTVSYYDHVTIVTGTTTGVNPGPTEPGFRFDSNNSGTATLYEFNATATGRVIFDNNAFDSILFNGTTGTNFDPYDVNVYQQLTPTLYLMITTPLSNFCPGGGASLNITVAANDSTAHTQCTTNDTFTAVAGASTETIYYDTTTDGLDLQIEITGDTWFVDDLAATTIGRDTVTLFENMYLGDGNQTIIITGLPTNNSFIDLGSLGGAVHVLDLTGYTTAATVDLNAGAASFGGRITFGDDITEFYGSNFADTVTGNNLNNIIETNGGADFATGGGGDDLFNVMTDNASDSYNGGSGTDTLTYNLASGALAVTINGTDTAVEGIATDSWAGFEVVNTGNANDSFTISNPIGYTTFNTYGGTDTFTIDLIGGTLPVINAGTGNDAFFIAETGPGSATLFGEDNDDTFTITQFDGRNNIFDGGNNTDAVVYNVTTPLTLVLQVGDDTVTNGATDTLRNMESVTLGSGFDSVTINDANGYTYVGSGGNSDTFNINAVNTVTMLDGGAGNDTANFTMFAPMVITLNGGTQSAVVGGVNQQIQNFEYFYTGGANDIFNVTSDNIVNLFDGNGGTDTTNLTSAVGTLITVNGGFGYTTVRDSSGPFSSIDDFYFDIENFTASAQNDTLLILDNGSTLNNVSNIYDGAGGTGDTATYNLTAFTPQNLTVQVTAGTDILVQDGSLAWTDTLRNFETVATGAGDDVWDVAGITSNRTLDGGANSAIGDEISYNTAGVDYNFFINTTGTSVQDGTLTFTHTLVNFERILSGAGNDTWTINNGSGTTNTTYDGQGGTDTMSYNDSLSNWSYNANLSAGSNTIVDNDPAAPDTDTLLNMEGLTTDNANDFITIHDSSIVTINTLDGNDIIVAGDGATGLDLQNNTFNMGAGTFDLISYSPNANAVTVNYTGSGAATVTEPGKGTDTLTGVERIEATQFNDTFNVAADATANTFYGYLGTDTINYTGVTPVTVNVGGSDTVVGGGGTDTLSGFEIIIGSDGADTFNVTNGVGYISLQGDAGIDTFTITNTGSAALVLNGGADADNYNFVAFDGFNNAINDAAGNNTVSYTGVGALDLDVVFSGANVTAVDNNINTDTFTGSFTNIQTSSGADEVFVRRALTGATVQTNAGNDTFYFENVLGVDHIGNGAALLDAGADVDTADFSAIAGVVNVAYTGCAVNTTVTTGLQSTVLTNFEAYVGGLAADDFNVTWGSCDVTFNGSAGADDIDYATSGTGLTFTLAATDTVSDGTNTHTLVSFAILRGTNQADVFDLVDTTGYTDVYGNNGADIFNIYPTTAATLHAGAGDDEFHIQAADTSNSTFDGEAGSDLYLVDFATTNNYAVTMNGVNGTATTGAFTDTLLNIEEVTTSNGTDTFTITWDGVANVFDAQGNTDALNYTSAVALAFTYTGAGAGTVVNGATTDTFSNFETFTGGAAADTFAITWDAIANTFAGGAGANSLSVTTANTYIVNYTGTGAGNIQTTPATVTDTFSGMSNITTLSGNDIFNIAADAQANTFTAGTGTDLANYSTSAAGIVVNYTVAVTVVAGGTDTLVGFEDITGSGLADTFNISGDAINNAFNGGAGTDIANYSTSAAGLTFNLDGGAETVTLGASTDTLTNFESIIATNQADIFNITGAGEGQYTALDGGGGSDTFNIEWGTTNNAIDGNTGLNSYVISGTTTANLTVTLNAGIGSVTDGTSTDTLDDIQNVTTSSGNDIFNITNDNEINIFTAGIGTDALNYTSATALTVNYTGTGAGTVAGLATDTFSGFETVTGGAGADTFAITWDAIDNSFGGGTGSDTANYSTSTANLTFDLDGGAETVTDATNTDTLTGFEVILGGSGADIFNVNSNTYSSITANGGADTINVTDATFGSAMTINGNAGTDAYAYTGTSPLTVSLTNVANTVTNGNAHTLSSIETVTLNTETGDNSTVAINNTAEVTSVTTGNGNETVTVTNAGTVTAVNTGAGTDSVTVAQDAVSTTVNGGTGTDTFAVTTTAASTATTVTQTVGTATMSVTANSNTDVFQNFENGTFTTSTGADIFTIDTDVAGDWTINSGTGANQYVFVGAGTGNVTVRIDSGNGNLDTLDFSAMTVGVTVNAGNIGGTQNVVGVAAGFKLILQDAIENVVGTALDDNITGTGSSDVINAGAGNDTVNAGAGTDTVVGGAGDDTINGGADADTVYGGTGTDTINGDAGTDTLFGGSLADATCTMGDDAGNDVITGGTDADTIYGGNNNTPASAGGDNACDDTGTDTLSGGDGTDTIYGGNLNDIGTNGTDADDTVNGDANNDELYGGNNNQGGGSGTDTNGDTIDGGANNDTAYGGNDNRTGGTGTESGGTGDTITNSEPNTNLGNRP